MVGTTDRKDLLNCCKFKDTSAKNIYCQTIIVYVLKQMNDWLHISRLSYIMHLQNELYFQRIQQEMQRFRNHFELVDEKNTKNVSLHFKIELILFKKNTIQSRL